MSQRRAAYRTDSNQAEIVKALRQIGASVTITAGLGDGFPDLAIGYQGVNHLAEVKASPREKLTEDERAWHTAWRGNAWLFYDPEQAVRTIREYLMEQEP
jgi:hypothetical protein